ncbi:TadE/TadG family type IV pilus assembly protein [Bradyrhizobium tropiciagri]|uniref:TadE/TadG family type IV pilus assembly protein n=1 Tax=Bradyrhizobium tropiciagri TaxID=312253 RepID=UPI000AEE5CF8
MLGSAISNRVRAAARRFSRSKSGNVGVMFTFAMLPILAFVGAAIDYTRANSARSSMQAALDSTALMLSKDLTMGNITAAQIPSKAQSYFNGLYTNKDGQGIAVSATYTTPTSSAAATILLSGSGFVKSDFMQLAGFPKLNFSSSTTTTWGNVKMRVALALDNTGSMAQDGKITALRNAVAGSGGLIDQLSALSKNNGDVYISVIPFAKVVNVGTSNSGQNWIDWTDWLNPPTTQPNNGSTQASLPMNWHAVGPGARCPWTNSNGGFTCNTSPTSTSNANYIPSSGTYSGYICPSVDYNSHTRYNGCWVSTPAGTGVFCTGSSSCACPKNSSGSNVTGCSCTTTGGVTSCSGNLYTHDWTQPGPLDLVHNLGQPRVGAWWAGPTTNGPRPTRPRRWRTTGCSRPPIRSVTGRAASPTAASRTMRPACCRIHPTSPRCSRPTSITRTARIIAAAAPRRSSSRSFRSATTGPR